MNVGMIGLGKLGLPCAEIMATKFKVRGYDINLRTSDSVKITNKLDVLTIASDIIFIAVPTPHDQQYGGELPTSNLPPKNFDYSIVLDTLTEISKHICDDQTIVLISTVLPGTVRELLTKINKDISNQLIYNPYLIAMGTVATDMVNPEMLIFGNKSGKIDKHVDRLIKFYAELMENNPNIVAGTWDEAECVKIFYNTFISTKISFVNMIQDVAQANGNINVDIVTDALADSSYRITGPKYMIAGMGDSGACHPRDNIALRWLSQKLELGYDFFGPIMHSREIQAKRLAEFIVKEADSSSASIYIHGKSYKPNVPYIDGSYSLLIASYIESMGKSVSWIDPLTEPSVPEQVRGVILLAHNASVTYDNQNSIPPLYTEILEGSTVIDPWRTYRTDLNINVIHYGNSRL